LTVYRIVTSINLLNHLQNTQHHNHRQARRVALGLVVLAVLLVLANLMSMRFVVEGRSMSPTLEDGQFLLISRMDYWFNEPLRGDIAVFHLNDTDLIKRIIGLPYETVEFRQGQVYINGAMLDEPYLPETCSIRHCPDSFWQLGADEYFVLGDNRNHSRDSRFFGAITRQNVIGKAILRYWPPQDYAWIQQIGMP